MSVLIKGMKMPEEGNYEARLNVNRDGTALLFLTGECGGHEAKELPPHGRLIDADKFKYDECGICDGCCETFNGNECSMCHKDCRCDFMKDIDEAPTILDSDNSVPCKEEAKE